MTTKEALASTLAALVRESGIRLLELAQRVGISDRSIRGYLSGAVFPDKHLDAILAELGVSSSRFLLLAASEASPARASTNFVITIDGLPADPTDESDLWRDLHAVASAAGALAEGVTVGDLEGHHAASPIRIDVRT